MATVRQKALAKRIVHKLKNTEKVIAYKEAEAVGYKSAASNIGHIMEKEGMRKELDRLMPDNFVAKKHEQTMKAFTFKKLAYGKVTPANAKKDAKKRGYDVVSAYQMFGITYVTIEVPDHLYVDKAIDKAYKVKGSYAPEKHEDVSPFKNMTDDELEAELKDLKKKKAALAKFTK